MRKKISSWFLLISLVLALAGCGAGGGGSADNPATGGADTTPPAVASKSPDNAATAVAINSSIIVTFSEAMDESTVNTTTFTVTDASNNAVAGTVTWNGTTARFTPSSNLAASTVYTVTIAAGVKDAAGNATTSDSTWTFTTGTTTADTTPPTVISTSPIDNATSVATNTTVTVTFSEAMDSTTITTTTFTVKDAANQAVTGAVTYDSGSKTATFTPSSALSNSTTYTATITTGAKDAAANAIATNYSWSFATIGQLTAVTVSSSINANTTWTSDKLYVIASSISVNAVLTIEPGTIIKFKAGKGMDVSGTGTLVANGTSTSPIIFTSYKDDANGGDTNGDGSASSPAMGDWDSIDLTGTGVTATFNYCQFYYSGYGTYKATIDLNSYSATIKNSTFAHNDGGTPSSIYGVIDASEAAVGTVITGNTFYGNNIPLTINDTFSIDDSNIFHNPANASQTNTYNGIFSPCCSFDLSTSLTWSETEVPFVMGDNQALIETGGSLALGDNVIVKFMSDTYIYSTGAIIANASSGNKIIFTSIKDDVHGGDTNGDGNITSPAIGDWGGIDFGASGSLTFNNVDFYYSKGSGIDLYSSYATITNSTFAYNDGGSLSSLKGVIDASDAKAETVITGNTFYGNNIPLTINDTFSIDDSNIFHNPANASQTNTYNGIFSPCCSFDLSTSLTWSETEVPFVMGDNQALIETGGSLALGDNTIIKFMNGAYLGLWDATTIVNSSGNGVYFTSIKDDAHGGDTNGDGTITSPAANDWSGIEYCDTNGCNWKTWSNILYDSH